MQSDFNSSSSFYGLKFGEFEHLPNRIRKKLVIVMSRIMERAYRRGVQQALELKARDAIDPEIESDLSKYRHYTSLAISYGIDGYKSTSLDRLMVEESLLSVGLVDGEA